MKDKEFEQLLQDSIRTHGREYLSADDDRHHIPILPHTFPDDFLSDVILPSQQPKKPALRVIRILSACAAVLVLVTVLTVVPAILNSRKTVDTQIAVPSASSVPTDHAPTNNAGHAPASDDSVSSVRPLPEFLPSGHLHRFPGRVRTWNARSPSPLRRKACSRSSGAPPLPSER